MNNLLEKLKKIDKKYFIVGGVAVAIVLLLVLVLVFGGSPERGKENNSQSTQNETEQSGISKDSEKDDKENVNNGQTDESENQESDSEDSENQDSENQNSENQNSNNTDDENSSSESDDSDNLNNNQNATGNGDSSSKPQNKPSTENDNSENSSESVTKPEQTPTTPSTPSTPSTPDEEETTKPDDSEENVNTEKYTINVFTTGGHKMYNVKVNIYKDSSLSELVTSVATDSNGRATAQLKSSKNYKITLSDVPEGYKVNASYSFSGKTALIVLESSIITGKPLPDRVLKEGDVMYDFTVPSAKGGNIKISDILKKKDLLVINFWYVNCSFCVKEFPMLEKAYLKYEDDAEVVALTPYDTMDDVKEFLAENPLKFQVATCDISIPNLFKVQAYPVSVFIDKYGVIREIERGALLEEDGFISVFEKYL